MRHVATFLPSPRHTCSRATTPHMRTFPPRRVSRHSSPTCLLPFSHPSAFLFLPLPLGARFRPSACLLFCAASSRRSGIVVQAVRLRRLWRPHTLAPPSQESLSGALSFIRRPPNHPTSIPRPRTRATSPPFSQARGTRAHEQPRHTCAHSLRNVCLSTAHPRASFPSLTRPPSSSSLSPSVRAFGPPPVCSSALPRLATQGLLAGGSKRVWAPQAAETHALHDDPRAARRGSAEEQTGGGPKARTEGEREAARAAKAEATAMAAERAAAA